VFCSLSCQVIIRRGEPIRGPPGPILVATRNDALDGIVDATPADRREGAAARPMIDNSVTSASTDSQGRACSLYSSDAGSYQQDHISMRINESKCAAMPATSIRGAPGLQL
jgi:hypothetical protein